MADKYTEKDAAKDTNSSVKDVKEAWHTARDDAEEPERTVSKAIKEGVSGVRRLLGLDDD